MLNSWQFTPFALFYLLGAMISFYLAYKSWNMRKTSGAIQFSLHFCGTGIWSLAYLLGFFNTSLPWKLFMIRFEYIGVILGLVFFVLSIANYTKQDRWINRNSLLAFAILPVITFVQIIFLEQHSLFYTSYGLTEDHNLVLFTKEYGTGFYLWTGFSYLCLLWSIIALIRSFIYQPKLFKNQLLPLSVSVAVFLFISVLYITKQNPIYPYDPTPLSIMILGLMMIVLVTRFKFLDLVPAAHSVVFKSLNNGVVVTDKFNRIIELNPAAEEKFGINKKDILGQPLQHYAPNLDKILANALDNPDLKTESDLGTNHMFEVQINPLKNRRGDDMGSVIMFHDITKLKQTMNDLNAYAYMVAHDLKNPLSQQQGIIELLGSEKQDIETEKKFFKVLQEGNIKMREIIDSLLLLAEIRNKEIEFIELDLNEISKSALTRLADNIQQESAEIIEPSQWPPCKGHKQWIEEVWVNYIQNAIKYGGRPPKIEIGADSVNGMVKCWVKDNGKGLSTDEQTEVFQEFKRLSKHSKSTSGHGLGLSVVLRIVKKLGGDAWVESDGKSGSTFFLTVPK